MNVLYISYDGILDPVGQSQVIPYLSGLIKKGASITLISFEKKDKLKSKYATSVQSDLITTGIKWIPLRYHKKPIIAATSFDIVQGLLVGLLITWRDSIKIIHARGYITGLIALFIKKLTKVSFIFDMRGFWADEKADAGTWSSHSIIYRLTKYLERVFICGSDEIVVLTKKARKTIQDKFERNHVSVIPCCVDLELFKPCLSDNSNLNLPPGRFIVTYLGSVGTFYRFDEIVHFYSLLREEIPEAFFLAITNNDLPLISETLSHYSIESNNYLITSVVHPEVPTILKQSTISLIFYHRPLSGVGCCPIKFGESLSCGVPVVINSGIGDCDQIVQKERVGVVIGKYTEDAYKEAIKSIQELLKEGNTLRERCRKVAEMYFPLDVGEQRYWEIYRRLRNPKGSPIPSL
ncbi:MAG: glycosyltransferase [Desulfobacterales bacterium]|nr:glycosyltransferase [Desulfobacterales bacterium]